MFVCSTCKCLLDVTIIILDAYFIVIVVKRPYFFFCPRRQVMELFAAAKKLGFAIPAVNVTSSSTANAVMEAAAALNSPIILQVSHFL